MIAPAYAVGLAFGDYCVEFTYLVESGYASVHYFDVSSRMELDKLLVEYHSFIINHIYGKSKFTVCIY